MADGAEAGHYDLPELMRPYAGVINDLDAHEVMPPSRWEEEFGPEVKPLLDVMLKASDGAAAPFLYNANIREDISEINAQSVWTLKMEDAPGAFDLKKRMQVMDFMGIDNQIVFPGSMALNAISLFANADNPEYFSAITGDRKAYGRRLLDLQNDWCARSWNKQNRLRMVAVLLADNVADMYATMKSLVDRGVRIFQFVSTQLPAGLSPAHPDLDPIWALGAASGSTFMLHVDGGAVVDFVRTQEWRKAPAFEGWRIGEELSLDPWTLTNLHLSAQNFISTMVLGGVFDRHPNLRIGCQEYGAHWVGPLAENMDRYYAYTPFPSTIGERKLKQKPSDYIRQHVRVAPFHFEPVGEYIDRYGFEDVYCFSTDFPHPEGGKRPMEDLSASMEGQRPDILRKFFVENARDLIPV